MFSKWMFYNTTQVLIYHGALDIICHFPGAQEMLATTNWKGKEEFHKSERKALWLYNEVHIFFYWTKTHSCYCSRTTDTQTGNSLYSRKFNPNPKFLGTAKAYFVCHSGPKFQITLIYAFIGCP